MKKSIMYGALVLAGLGLLTNSALPQGNCPCPGPVLLAGNNAGQVTISAPWHITGDYAAADNASYFKIQVNSGLADVPAGTYLGWCVDAIDNIGEGPTLYSSLFWSSSDANLNTEIGPGYPLSVYVSPTVWHEVNYILNHKNGAYFGNIQQAIWFLIGGPIPATGFPSISTDSAADLAQVAALVADAQANAALWQPQCGDVT